LQEILPNENSDVNAPVDLENEQTLIEYSLFLYQLLVEKMVEKRVIDVTAQHHALLEITQDRHSGVED
jgi:hypothetical protein